MSSKFLLRIGINSLIGIVLIIVWLKLVNPDEIIQVIEKVNPAVIIPSVGLFALTGFFRAWRLKIILYDIKPKLADLIYLTYLSQLLSFLIPIRAGEITKGVYLSTHYQLKLTRGVGLIFLDRFFDFWLVVFLSLVLLMVVPNNLPGGLVNGLLLILIIFSAMTFLFLLIPQKLKFLLLSFKKLLVFSFVKKIYTQIIDFITDTAVLLKSNISSLGTIFVLTFLATIGEALVWIILLSSILGPVNFLTTLLGSMLNSLTFLIPAAPGYVGSAEAAGLAVFNLGLGYDKTAVAAATVLYHACVLVFILFFGLLGLYLLKFDLKFVWRKLRTKTKD